MSDIERFAVLIVIASIAFLAVLSFSTKGRATKPSLARLFLLTFVVVACGMLFARYGHIIFRLPWWIYYGLPALATFLLPPFTLRMSRVEVIRYVPMSVLIAPVIHLFVSLLIGWHDYMPFPVYIPSLKELAHRFA